MEAGCKQPAPLRKWAESSSTGEVPHCLAPTRVALQCWGTPSTKRLGPELGEPHDCWAPRAWLSAWLAERGLGWKKLPSKHASKE